MRKLVTFLMTLLVGATSYVNAESAQVNFEAGYRHDNISWRHHTNGIFSTNTRFKDLDIFQIGLEGRATVGCNFYVRAGANWGWILDGEFKQTLSANIGSEVFGTFDGSFGNEFEFSTYNRDVIDDRYVYDLNAAIGYPFYFCDCSIALAPVVGYAFDEQNVRVQNGDNRLNFFDDYYSSGNDGCCWHKFSNRWYGPFIGVDFTYRPSNECWNLYGEIEYHFAHFKGRTSHDTDFDFNNWNHTAKHGHGWVVGVGADYDFSNDWTVGLNFKFQDYCASRSHRNFFSFSSGSDSDYSSSSQSGSAKNHHKWHSYAINLAIGHQF